MISSVAHQDSVRDKFWAWSKYDREQDRQRDRMRLDKHASQHNTKASGISTASESQTLSIIEDHIKTKMHHWNSCKKRIYVLYCIGRKQDIYTRWGNKGAIERDIYSNRGSKRTKKRERDLLWEGDKNGGGMKDDTLVGEKVRGGARRTA